MVGTVPAGPLRADTGPVAATNVLFRHGNSHGLADASVQYKDAMLLPTGSANTVSHTDAIESPIWWCFLIFSTEGALFLCWL
jgi:hypothetical protein